MKEDKGHGKLFLYRTNYIEKCCNIINTNQFSKKIPQKPQKSKYNTTSTLRHKLKDKVSEKSKYKKFYPTGSRLGQFYGTAKVHKLQPRQNLDGLTSKPIISNLEAATYEIAKYLTASLRPLSKSENTILNTADFIKRI